MNSFKEFLQENIEVALDYNYSLQIVWFAKKSCNFWLFG